MTDATHGVQGWTHEAQLSVLARAEDKALKVFAETLLGQLPDIEVIENRTGLVMLPMRDTAQGTHFHLGEVLVSEARIAAGQQEGYGLRRGRDLEAAMAMAVVDLAVALGAAQGACLSFLEAASRTQADADTETLRRVEATRVDMETF